MVSLKNIEITGYQLELMKKEEFLERSGDISGEFIRNSFVVFPERFIIDPVDEQSDSDLFYRLEEMSRRVTLIAGSLIVRERGNLYNRSYVYHRGKMIGYQDKIVPFNREKSRITPGRVIKVFSCDDITFSVPVCYDLDFPFFSKISSMNGVRIIFNPSLIRRDFHDEWHQYMVTRALENRIAVLSVNSLTEQFNGDSIFVQTYVEDDGVRITRTDLGKERRKSLTFIPGNINAKFIQRHEEDPGIYSFPVKKINY